MNLKYSIPNKLYWIDNFLDYNTYKGIHNSIFREREQINFYSTENVWGKFLHKNLVPPMKTELNGYKPIENLITLLKHNPYFTLDELKEVSVNIHYMQKGAGVNWHNDGKWKYGATYYINHRWSENSGGEFMFTDKEGHSWIPVLGNSLVLVKAPLQHKVNPVLNPFIPRISIQIFMK